MPIVNAPSSPPPRKTAPKSQQAKKAEPSVDIQQERKDAINGVWQMISAGLVIGNQWADAGAINMHGPNITNETVKLANKYEKIANGIDALSAVGPWTGIITATLPLVLQLAANHKRLPAEKLGAVGVKDPRVLESEMRVMAQRQAMEYQNAVAAQEAEMEALQREFSEMSDVVREARRANRETVPVS